MKDILLQVSQSTLFEARKGLTSNEQEMEALREQLIHRP
jgi:hypothetical protein